MGLSSSRRAPRQLARRHSGTTREPTALEYYPLSTRTMVFMAPVRALLAWAGLTAGLLARRRQIAVATVATLCVIPAFGAVRSVANLSTPLGGDDGVRAAMEHLAEEQRAGDTVFLNCAAQYPLAYYVSGDCAPSPVRRAWRSGLCALGRWTARRGSSLRRAPQYGRLQNRNVPGIRRLRRRGRSRCAGRSITRLGARTFLRPEDEALFSALPDRRSRPIASFGDGRRVDSAHLSLQDFEPDKR
jgi:hypothetical protein